MANDRRVRRQLALAAVAEVAHRLGLNDAGADVIADSNNVVIRLPAEDIVAKTSTGVLAGRGGAALERELLLGRRLAEHGVPIATPVSGPVAGLHRTPGVVLTLWRYVMPGARPDDGDRLLGEAVRHFHAALADIVGELPELAERIDRANRLFQDPSSTPGLAAADRTLAAGAHRRLAPLVRSLGQATALHAEPHEDNILWTERGPLLIDFEAVCRGPAEWDLAYLPPAALASFPERNDAAIARLRAGVSFCVAAWCLADLDPSPAVAEAATVHWRALRESWLVR